MAICRKCRAEAESADSSDPAAAQRLYQKCLQSLDADPHFYTTAIAMDDLDLLRLTEVLGFGSISGRLDGRINGLRLVDWTPVAFDARLITDEAKGVKQRISQRAVQNISSVGDASFVSSLQGQLTGLYDGAQSSQRHVVFRENS